MKLTCKSCYFFRESPDGVTHCQHRIDVWINNTKIENIGSQGVFGEFTFPSTEACAFYREQCKCCGELLDVYNGQDQKMEEDNEESC